MRFMMTIGFLFFLCSLFYCSTGSPTTTTECLTVVNKVRDVWELGHLKMDEEIRDLAVSEYSGRCHQSSHRFDGFTVLKYKTGHVFPKEILDSRVQRFACFECEDEENVSMMILEIDKESSGIPSFPGLNSENRQLYFLLAIKF